MFSSFSRLRIPKFVEKAEGTTSRHDGRRWCRRRNEFLQFMGAVIDEKSWRKLSGAVDAVRHTAGVELVAGGDKNMSRGYFVHPALIKAEDATSRYMTEEFFGPMVTAFVYPDSRFDELSR